MHLPAVPPVGVDLQRDVITVHQNPETAIGVKGQVQRAVGERQPAVGNQLVFALKVEGEEVQPWHSEETRDQSQGFPSPQQQTSKNNIFRTKITFHQLEALNRHKSSNILIEI